MASEKEAAPTTVVSDSPTCVYIYIYIYIYIPAVKRVRVGSGYYTNPGRIRPVYISNIKKKKILKPLTLDINIL